MTQDDLNKILKDRRLWLKTDGKEGVRADLRCANFAERKECWGLKVKPTGL